jgi:DNA primase
VSVIAPETIDKIRELSDLGQIVGESVKLERRGRSLIGLCPFHKERSPSFNVNEDRGFYHCFGCKASGDVFKFVQETEGLSFIEAVRSLGERLGIEVDDDLSTEDRKKRVADKRRQDALYRANESAADFFERCLKAHDLSHFAHEELARRELSMDGEHRDTLKAFRLGYAPDAWDELSQHLRKAGHDLRAAEAVGLIAPRRGGQGYYDRFRHRLMFAIVDLHGRVVAFSGRSLPSAKETEEESPAKYINSAESPIYKKRATVFGLYQARTALRAGKPCILVEGNFDVVSLHARGFENTVAPLGTAFTIEQGKQIKRFTTELTLLFDGDSAGRKATLASREPAHEAGLNARVAQLPDGIDPDDFIRAKGAEAMTHLLTGARGLLDHLISGVLDETFQSTDAVGQAQKIQQVVDLLKSEDDPNVSALAEQYADRLAGRLGVADAHTFRALRNNVRKKLASNGPTDSDRRDREPHEVSASPSDLRARAVGLTIFGALLDFPELLDSTELTEASIHVHGDLAAAIAYLRESHDVQKARSSTLAEALGRLPQQLADFTAHRLAAPKHHDIDAARVELFANLDKLRRMELTRLSSGALGELERARQEGDFDQELSLLREQELRARERRGL